MIKILVVDDQNLVRQTLQAIFDTQSDFKIIGMARNGIEAIDYLEDHNIDIALVDLEMPEMDGLTLSKIICHRFPETQIIILSSSDDRDSINKAIQIGARGYLLKDTSQSEIVDTVRYVQRGYFQLGPGLFEKLIFNLINQDRVASGQLENLDEKYSYYVDNLKQEIDLKTQITHEQLTKEIESKVKNLQTKFKEGLELFQHQVTEQIQTGMEDFMKRFRKNQKDNANQNLEQQVLINQQLLSMRLLVRKLEKRISILSYCLIIIFLCYFVEKVTLLKF